MGRGNDNIATSLRNPALFAPTSGADPLTKEQGTNVAAAPPQVPKGVDEEELTKDASTACKGLIALIIGMVIIQLWVKGNFRDFWVLFFALQFICYTHYYDTPLPGNAEIYIHELTKLIELSAVNPDILIRAWINPDFNPKLDVIDKDAHISVWNDTKLYLLLIAVFAAIVLLMLILSLVKCVRGQLKEGLSVIKAKFVWDYSIQFFYMAYLKLCMTVMNQIDLNVRDSAFWRATDSDASLAIGVVLIACPVIAFCFLCYKSDELGDAQVKAKYQNLYQDAALYRSKFAKFYSVAFALRRIAFISIPFLFSQPMMQVMVFMIFHSLYLVAYVSVNPHVDTKRTYVEVFNEVALMFFMYHLAGWNGLIADLQTQFDAGYSFISLVLLTLLVNLAVIVGRAIENWRHKRAIELNRLIILERLEKLKMGELDADKTGEKKKIRDEFILKKMLENEANKIGSETVVNSRKKHGRLQSVGQSRGGNSNNQTQVHEEHSHSELQHNQDLSAYDKPAYYQKRPVNVIEGMETHDH